MEADPHLAARLTPPRLSDRLVPRDDLLGRLHTGRHCRLTLLCAPAGYGKSIALAQWRKRLAADGARVAWLVAGRDDGPHAFCSNLCHSLRQAGLSVRWQPSAEANADALTRDLITVLAGAVGELYVVLDEADHLRQPGTRAILLALLEARLPTLHLVMASRRECDLPLGKLRGAGELSEIGPADLAFSPAETQILLARRANGSCHADIDLLDTSMRLHDVTEGWIAGMELITAQAGLHVLPLAPAAMRCPATIQSYFEEAVLPGVTQPLLDWAAGASLLRRFNADLAAHVTGDADSGARVAQARSLGLFLQPAAARADGWWRFHPQFASVLRRRRAPCHPDEKARHRRAAEWLAQQGDVSEALTHAMNSGDVLVVIAVLAHVAADIPAVSQLREFLCWLEDRGEEQAVDHPGLCLTAAWAGVVAARPLEALKWLQHWKHFGACDAATVEQHVGLISAAIAVQRDDLPRALDIIHALPDRPMPGPALNHIRMAVATRCGAMVGHRTPHVPSASSDVSELALMRAGTAAAAAWLEGHAYDALRLGGPALAAAERVHGRRSVAACLCAVPVACALYERDEPQKAREQLAGRFELMRFATPDVIIEAAVCRARLLAYSGSIPEALAGLAEAESVFYQRDLPRGVAWALAEQVRLALLVHDRRHAARLQRALDDLARCHASGTPRDQEIAAVAGISSARAGLAAGDPERALASVETGRTRAEGCGRASLVACADLLQAVALSDLGQASAARDYLDVAQAAGARLGLVRSFADEGERARNLLAEATCAVPVCYASRDAMTWESDTRRREAVALAAAAPYSTRSVGPDDIGSALGHLITRREGEILALLEKAMTNKHIAQALNLSVDTVKWNMRQIFGKLGVSRRYDAILKVRSAVQGAADKL